MKLKLRRSQKQGMTGIKFILFAIIDQEFFLYVSDPTNNWQQQLDLKQAHEISQFLKRHLLFIENADDYFVEACEKLSLLFEGIVNGISLVPATEDSFSFLQLNTPLMNLMADPVLAIERTVATLFDKDISDKQLFEETRQQLIHNLSLLVILAGISLIISFTILAGSRKILVAQSLSQIIRWLSTLLKRRVCET